MSHRNLSWLLTLLAFLLFGLACTLSRNKKGKFKITPKKTLAKIEETAKKDHKANTAPNKAVIASCGLNYFYKENSSFLKPMPPVLENAIKIKLAEDISNSLKNNPSSLSEQVKKCIKKNGQHITESPIFADADY